MKPRSKNTQHDQDLFRSRLDSIINLKHELVLLSQRIDWDYLDAQVQDLYAGTGRPGIPTRMMAGLHILKYTYDLSDEAVCERWVYDPYFQYFCGETFFQHQFPIERSSMTHWRQRVKTEFVEKLLQESLKIGFESKALQRQHFERVIVDTTVQPKAVTFPVDSKLRYKAICLA